MDAKDWYDPIKVITPENMGGDGVRFALGFSEIKSLTTPRSDMYHTSLVNVTFVDEENNKTKKVGHIVASTAKWWHPKKDEPTILWDTYFCDPKTADYIVMARLQSPTVALDALLNYESSSEPVMDLVEKQPPDTRDNIAIMKQWAQSLLMVNYQQHPLGQHITRYLLDMHNRHKVLDQIPFKFLDGGLVLNSWQEDVLEKKLFLGLDFENQELLHKKWPNSFSKF